MNINDLDFTNWKDIDINVDSLWIYNQRDKTGKHKNIYHGNFIPQIPKQLIKRYTKKGDTVFEPFMGSGTTLFECENLERKYIGFDINPEMIKYVSNQMETTKYKDFSIFEIDACNAQSTSDAIDKCGVENYQLAILHPPYFDIIKFTKKKEDLSNSKSVDDFFQQMKKVLSNTLERLENGRYFAIVIGDMYRNQEIIPLSFYMLHLVKKNFNVLLKGIIIKNIEGNKGKIGVNNIWKYRAMKSDYFIFKHEYILVFKKK